MTNSLFRTRESLERGRKIRKDELNEYQTKQARCLELIEKVANAVEGAISSLGTEIAYDESIVVHIQSRFGGVPEVHLQLCSDGSSDLADIGIPF